MENKQKLVGIRKRGEQGYTLLEYCAGAAVILGIMYVALRGMGQNVSTLLTRIGDWATEASENIETADNTPDNAGTDND